MKHIRLYENFDLDAFMKDPDSYFHNDDSPEIEIGDYVSSYRGVGQVLNMEADFVKVQLIDGPKSRCSPDSTITYQYKTRIGCVNVRPTGLSRHYGFY